MSEAPADSSISRPILLVTGDFVKTGGMDRANYALADYLARQNREIHLVAFRVADDLAARPGVTFHPVRKPLDSYFLSLPLLDLRGRKVARQIAARGGRVIVNGGNCRFADVNWVHHVHATDPLKPSGGLARRIKSTLAKAIWRREERPRIPQARVIITTCNRTRQDLSRALSIPEGRIKVVYLGVDAERFRPRPLDERTKLRADFGWPDVPHVAFVGAMGDRRKGFDVLYRAWQRLCADDNWNCRLIVVGRGADAAYWQQRSRDDRLAERIAFLEFVPDLAEMMACCDAHVLPSRYEGYSMVTHEAICCDVPALVSANAGIAERYPEPLRDLLIDDPTDVMEVERRLRLWYDHRESLNAATRDFSAVLRGYTWDDMARDFVAAMDADDGIESMPRSDGGAGDVKVLALLGDRVCPPTTGVRVRNYHLWPAVRALVTELRVLSLDLSRGVPSSEPCEGPPACDTKFFCSKRQALPVRALSAMRFSYHQWPKSMALAAAVDALIESWRPDVVHAEELRMAWYLPTLRGRPAGTALQTLTMHNVESDLLARTGSADVPIFRDFAKLQQVRSLLRFESDIARRADLVFAYSPIDRARLQSLYPGGHWSETRGGADVSGVEPAPEPTSRSVLIPGSLSYAPNIAGLEWFLRDVRPRLSGDLSITVAGSGAGARVRGMVAESAGIAFVDTPPSLAPLYASHAVCAIPLLHGSGTRGRILEALAHGRMVVTTTKGVEGLNIGADQGVIIADDPSAFARQLDEWTARQQQRASLVAAGRAWVRDRYDWPVVARELVTNWDQARKPPERGA